MLHLGRQPHELGTGDMSQNQDRVVRLALVYTLQKPHSCGLAPSELSPAPCPCLSGALLTLLPPCLTQCTSAALRPHQCTSAAPLPPNPTETTIAHAHLEHIAADDMRDWQAVVNRREESVELDVPAWQGGWGGSGSSSSS